MKMKIEDPEQESDMSHELNWICCCWLSDLLFCWHAKGFGGCLSVAVDEDQQKGWCQLQLIDAGGGCTTEHTMQSTAIHRNH